MDLTQTSLLSPVQPFCNLTADLCGTQMMLHLLDVTSDVLFRVSPHLAVTATVFAECSACSSAFPMTARTLQTAAVAVVLFALSTGQLFLFGLSLQGFEELHLDHKVHVFGAESIRTCGNVLLKKGFQATGRSFLSLAAGCLFLEELMARPTFGGPPSSIFS